MLFSPVFVTLHLRFALPPREPHCPASAATALWAISTEPNCRPSPNNSHSGTQFATPNTPTTLKFFLFTFLRTLLQFFAPAKNSTLLFSSNSALFTQKPPGWGVPLSPKSRRKPRLGYTLLSGGSLVGSRQEYPAHPHRPVSHRQSSRRQSRVFRPHARVPSSCAPHPGAACRPEQFYPVDRLVRHRHAHSAFFRNLHSRRAGRRRPDRHFQWLDHAEKQRGSGPWPGRPEKSESQRCFSQRLLPSHSPAYCWTGLHLHGHHAWRQRTAPPRPESPRDSRGGDWFRAGSRKYLSLLRILGPPRRLHWRKRHEHHPAAFFLSSRLHRRPDPLERCARLVTISSRWSLSDARANW